MIAYLDTSALLRVVLREPGALDDLRTYDGLVSSELIAVESARTIDRLRMHGALTLDEAAERISAIHDWLEAIDLVRTNAELAGLRDSPTVERERGDVNRTAGDRTRGLRRESPRLAPFLVVSSHGRIESRKPSFDHVDWKSNADWRPFAFGHK